MKKALIAVIVFSGILLALQVRSFKNVALLTQRTQPADILAELRTFQIANANVKARIIEEEKNLENIRSKIASETIEEEIAKLQLIGGEQTISGQGVEINFSGPIKAYWVSDLLAQLVSGGAEAIAINDIRLTASTFGFRDVAGGLLMRRTFLRPPLRLSVIGSKDELKRAITSRGGILDRIKDAHPGVAVIVAERDAIIIPALTVD